MELFYHGYALPGGNAVLGGAGVEDTGAVEGFGVGAGAGEGYIVAAFLGIRMVCGCGRGGGGEGGQRLGDGCI